MLTSLPSPTPDETQERFIVRAHRALQEVDHEPERRNEAIWALWHQHRGATEEERIAQEKFPADRFLKKDNVCVFTEHTATSSDGQPVTYDLVELVRILRGCNHRIADFDGFAPISDGHTPDPQEPFRIQPEILGYAGPYRLGMIGRRQPRWAIFADEWHLRNAADRLAGLPRRSVELWRFKSDPSRSHFDPIAALGAETPRIPLPFKFSRRMEQDAVVEKYSFDAASLASPGGSNTHVLTFSQEKYSMPLSNEDISQLLAALMQTPQFQFLDQQMKAAQGGAAGGEAPVGTGEPNANPDDLAALNELAGTGGSPTGSSPPPEPEKNMACNAKYSARQGDAVVEKYAALQSAHNRLVQDFGRAQAQIASLHKRAADADRTTAIMELRTKFGDVVDVEDELSRTLYARGANMSDDAFAAHVVTVEKYAQRATQFARTRGAELPVGVPDYRGNDVERDRYQASLSDEAVRIHARAVNAGRHMTYDEAMDEARKIVGPGPGR